MLEPVLENLNVCDVPWQAAELPPLEGLLPGLLVPSVHLHGVGCLQVVEPLVNQMALLSERTINDSWMDTQPMTLCYV